MKTATEIVRPAPYGRMHVWCKKHQSRHAIDKPCDASIQAYRLEFEAEVRETKRKADRDYYKKKKDEEKQHASELTIVENIDKSQAVNPLPPFIEEIADQIIAAAKKVDPVQVEDESPPRDTLLQSARQAGALTKAWRKSRIENDAELSAAAEKAAESWREIASALTDRDEDGEDSFCEGAIDKLVARQMSDEREKKKFNEYIKDCRRQEQPGIEELAARLVKLDADVARQVFNCLAMRGPCGGMEGVNFILSQPLALALERALDTQSDAPACAAAS